jgi:type I restriction enzyme S subunit
MGTLKNITYNRYSSYKDSGVEWLGEIPMNWDVVPGLNFIFENKDRNKGMIRKTILSLSYGKIRIKGEDELTGLVPESFETYQLVNKGDLIFRPTDLQNDTVSLRSSISEFEGIITNAYLNLRFKSKANSKFFHYFFRAIDNNKIIYGLGSGLRQNISFLDFRRFLFPFPPLPEQKAIAEFLDRKTALIDQAIDIKQKQIELLKERRQILIHKAVTRGLDPTVKMKDSGNDAVGQIPEHWQINKLRNSLKPVSIKNHPHLPLLSITRELGVIERNIDDPDENHNFIPEDLSGYKLIREGQFGMNKMKAWQGSYGISPFTGIVSPAYFVFDLISDIIPSFFHLAIRSKFYIPFFVQASDGVRIGQWDLSKERMKEIPIIIPPKEEQMQIVSFIERAIEKIMIAINAKEKEIEKLKEYKATLINSAVTGKIKVYNDAE